MKLELGAGNRGTRGYVHHDAYQFPDIDIVCKPWELPYGDGEVEEVLALAFIEHLTYYEAVDTFREVHRILQPGGRFFFDVPDYPAWAGYYLRQFGSTSGEPYTDIPDLDHCRKTLFGWQRWPGDEHKYGWDLPHLTETLHSCGLNPNGDTKTVEAFQRRAHRNRFDDPRDAHLYMICTK